MWDFIQADISQPILAEDFLATFNLCVNISQGVVSTSDSRINSVNFVNILQEFPDVAGDVPFSSTPHVHEFHHHILTEGPSIFSKARNLDPEKLQAAKTKFSKLEME